MLNLRALALDEHGPILQFVAIGETARLTPLEALFRLLRYESCGDYKIDGVLDFDWPIGPGVRCLNSGPWPRFSRF